VEPLLIDQIRTNYRTILERVAAAADSVGRDPAEIKLVVVTKGHNLEVAKATLQAGAKYLGENYLQDALPKIQSLADSNTEAEWHMIGHVQSRKARDVVQHFAWLHSLDRLKLARRCNQFAGEMGRSIPVLLECNISAEGSKHGWPAWDEARWPDLAADLAEVVACRNLDVRGLMTMPPFEPDPEAARPYFVKLRKLRDYLRRHFPDVDWDELSMGMSNDFEVAIQEGATFVRVGTAIVGARSYGTIQS
jgi:PLP dependent protein